MDTELSNHGIFASFYTAGARDVRNVWRGVGCVRRRAESKCRSHSTAGHVLAAGYEHHGAGAAREWTTPNPGAIGECMGNKALDPPTSRSRAVKIRWQKCCHKTTENVNFPLISAFG